MDLRLLDAPTQPTQPNVVPVESKPTPRELAERDLHDGAMLDLFRVLGHVLSARAQILIFGLCGFAIALIGALRESREILFVFIAWCVLTVIPAIVLEIMRRRE